MFASFSSNFFFIFSLQANLTDIPRSEYVPGIGYGIAKCPYDPLDNSTAIYVEHGNPGGLPALVSVFFFYFLQCLYIFYTKLLKRSRKSKKKIK